jgi:5-methyltetrahydrofolate--homocysteine methyltransferase
MVFGSIGPSGRVLLAEEVTRDRLFEAFRETADALEWGGADALVLETFSEMEELRIAYRAAKRATQLPVIVSMSFDAQDGLYTQLGIRPEQLADEARRLGADAVGANCGIGTESAIAVARSLVARTDLPVWIKANAGLPHQASGGVLTWPEEPETFARFAACLREMGVRMIGGCCGTGPKHIRAMRAALHDE